MSDIVISARGIGKRYRIGLKEVNNETLVEQTLRMLKSPFTNLARLRKFSRFNENEDDSVFWALRDIEFDVSHGEVLGIIGHNGAGKSTLLKILSQITEPTTGEIRMHGRVSSLLEVGTGFHPDLTGRENVYMNGTILGMRKREIDSKFSEIVEFSGVGKYIDTPVKRYSSGMKVRLAFSVAAHLEPDVLVIDEVLAVGDVEFQRKCLGKMEDVATKGRTVLFVSHDMAAVRALCKRVILLQNGMIVYNGNVDDAINHYLESAETRCISPGEPFNLEQYNTIDTLHLNSLALLTENSIGAICSGSDFSVIVEFLLKEPDLGKHLRFAVTIKDRSGEKLFVMDNVHMKTGVFRPGIRSITFDVERFPLVPGLYKLDLWIADRGIQLFYIKDQIEFEVIPVSSYGHSKIKRREKHGYFLVDYTIDIK